VDKSYDSASHLHKLLDYSIRNAGKPTEPIQHRKYQQPQVAPDIAKIQPKMHQCPAQTSTACKQHSRGANREGLLEMWLWISCSLTCNESKWLIVVSCEIWLDGKLILTACSDEREQQSLEPRHRTRPQCNPTNPPEIPISITAVHQAGPR